MTPSFPVPRRAATVILVRDGPAGLEVLLLRRAERGDHNSGAWVFPGGLVDPADRLAHPWCVGLDDRAASVRLGLAVGGLDDWIASVRECFEEAGVLLAVDGQGRWVDLSGSLGARLRALRGPLHRGELGLAALCERHGLRLAVDRLHYVGHWLTPRGRAKRFDTRFFLAALPPGQHSEPDATETTDQAWLPPAQALAEQHLRRLLPPTRAMLEMLARHGDTESLLAWAGQPHVWPCILPRLAAGPGGVVSIGPGHPAYAEVGRLDPLDRGLAACELHPGVAVELAPGLRRWVRPADGGNAYVVAGTRAVVIDPGPADDDVLDALRAVAGVPIEHVLTTTATDPHALETARRLAARSGARRHGAGVEGAAPALLDLGGVELHGLAGADGRHAVWLPEPRMLVGASPPLPAWPGVEPAWLAPPHGFLIDLATPNDPR